MTKKKVSSLSKNSYVHENNIRLYISIFNFNHGPGPNLTLSPNSRLPYLPDYPETFSGGNILARAVDGLGYRYYWATEGLTQTDLDYKPTEDARSTFETLQHLYGLAETILNAPQSAPNIRPADFSELSYEALRTETLNRLKKASELYSQLSEEDLSKAKVVFQRGDNQYDFPLWNMINGPIADALYHTGQVVSFRRSSGNPMNPKVNVFTGKNRE